MSRSTHSAHVSEAPIEPFDERVAMLAEELEFAIRMQRPSILLVFYASETVRAQVERSLQARLEPAGQQLVQVTVDAEHFDVPLLLARRPDRERSVYSVGGLGWGGGKAGANAYRALNMRREFFVDYQIRAVFWLTQAEAADLTYHAPDFWAFRHRVLEFNDLPELGLTAASQVDDFLDVPPASIPPADLDEQIGSRQALLAGLPQGSDALAMRLDLLVALAGLCQVRQAGSQAVKYLKQALELAKTSPAERLADFWTRLGQVYLGLGEDLRAVRALRKALRLQSDQAEAWIALGRTYLKQGRAAAARTAFRKATLHAPGHPGAWTGLGRAWSRLGQVDKAGQAFQTAARLAPGEPGVWINLGLFHLDRGQIPEAQLACQEAVRAVPDAPVAWFNLGQIVQTERQSADAIIIYRKALELDPHHLPARLALIACYRLSGQDELASLEIGRLTPELSQADEYPRAVLAALSGETSAALDLLATALEKKQVGPNGLRRNPSLACLQGEPRFQAWLDESRSEPLDGGAA